MKTIVQFDMDGVLSDFHAGYHQLQRQLGQEPADRENWNNFLNDRVWEHIDMSRNFWYNLPPLVSSEVFERIDRLQEHVPIYFVTARPGLDVKRQTEDWLVKRKVTLPTVICTSKKGYFARAVGVSHSIEDKAGNAVYISYESPATKSYLINCAWNQFDGSILGSKVIRVDKVEQFLDDVEASL